jgi:hypothetical protein
MVSSKSRRRALLITSEKPLPALRPKYPSGQGIRVPKIQQFPTRPIRPTPSKNLFRSNPEYHCFKNFCHQTAARFNSCWQSDACTRMILQAGETNSIIRHAIIALGALNFDTWADVGHGMCGHQPVFAYHQYNMAITGLRKLAKEGYEETRASLHT